MSRESGAIQIERIGLTSRWCDAAVAGGMVFIAGHTAEKTRGGALASQTKEVLDSLEKTLECSGSSKEQLLFVQIYLSNIEAIGEMNAVWDNWVAAGAAPARATVEAKLAKPEYQIEITAVAVKTA